MRGPLAAAQVNSWTVEYLVRRSWRWRGRAPPEPRGGHSLLGREAAAGLGSCAQMFSCSAGCRKTHTDATNPGAKRGERARRPHPLMGAPLQAHLARRAASAAAELLKSTEAALLETGKLRSKELSEV